MVFEWVYSLLGKENINRIEQLHEGGSDRKYKRIVLNTGNSMLLCENEHILENESFFYFHQLFQSISVPVPEVYHIHPQRSAYLLQDLGDTHLLSFVGKNNSTTNYSQYYKNAIQDLIKIQIKGDQICDYNRCTPYKQFDSYMVWNDLMYCKHYFLDIKKMHYDKIVFYQECEKMAKFLGDAPYQYLMFRDFQGRNILLHQEKNYYIDFQSCLKGPIVYDVASLLWQAKANLPLEFRTEMFAFYKSELKKYIDFDEEALDKLYSYILLIRLLQVLGAYGLRGIIEKKKHFYDSIPFAIKNIEHWLTLYGKQINEYPTLFNILQHIITPNHLKGESHKQELSSCDLEILIQSFSFKKGFPEDESGNGGGYVFDCRGILNPGRYDEYKKLTGRDKPVIDFLEQKTSINQWLQHIFNTIQFNIEDYLQRGFKNLQISFGCTGGQHRSVYSTDKMAQMISEKFPQIKLTVRHCVQDAKQWINE